MKIIKILFIFTISSFALISCGENISKNENINGVVQKESDDEIVIWAHFDGFKDAIDEFEKNNPEYTIKLETFSYEEYLNKYLDVLGTDNAPDIMIIDSNEFGVFTTLDTFEDLLQEPYNIEKYKDPKETPYFDEEAWKLGYSFDNKKMYGVAYASAPIVTYYRYDILKENGFPCEPDELAEFMKEPNNWLEMGKKLRDKGIYITQWAADPITITTKCIPAFDEELNFLYGKSDMFKRHLEVVKDSRNAGMVAGKDIWLPEGEKYIVDGNYAMLYLGSWGSATIENIVTKAGKLDEHKGKWAVTSLPFGLYGWSNSTIMSIPKNSKNKEGAWKFMEYYCFERTHDGIGSVPTYVNPENSNENLSYKNRFLYNEDEQELYKKVMSKTEEFRVTTLDKTVFKTWEEILKTDLDELSVEQLIKKIEDQVKKNTSIDKEILLENLNK